MLLDLLRKKPVLWIAFSNSGRFAAAYARAIGYFLNKAGVTMFTRTSVHCADKIVAISSSNGLEKSSAQRASAYSFAKSLAILRAWRFEPSALAAAMGSCAEVDL